MERRLAAIMAIDVVGYSRLIRADEEGTIAALQALRADQTGRIHISDFRNPENSRLRSAAGPYIRVTRRFPAISSPASASER